MAAPSSLPFDPVEEAARKWSARWDDADSMAVATSIMRVQQLLLGRIEAALRPLNLTFARYEALVLLCFSRNGSLPMSKMGQRLMVHPTSITNIVDRLQAQEFIRREPHPTDRRTTLVAITESGRAVTERATQALVEVRFALDALDPDQMKSLYDLLRDVRLHAGDFPDDHGIRTWPNAFEDAEEDRP
ncbi:MarR family winged helix-turn-helix transcriptional regulator [Cryptosporangium sp. NPDC051539]|uniref:MarR family winged helix-turn-helix transcriptional regulator n=1 Tax=Cryptosporangium sp. NPDC051539 TaxID=3363962 RepID=UPI00379787F8